MRAPLNRVNRAAGITLAVASAAALLTGCKSATDQADLQLTQQLQAANAKLETSRGDPASAISLFKQATEIPDISPAAKIEAELALANVNEHAAAIILHKMEVRQGRIVSDTQQIDELVNHLQSNKTEIDGLQKHDPQATLDDLSKMQSNLAGSADIAEWVKGDNGGSIPSAAANNAKMAALKDSIDKLTTQKNNLQAQRNQLLQQADQLRIQSEAAKGKQSLDLYTQSADLTKQASLLQIQSDGVDNDLFKAQQQLDLATKTAQQLDAAATAFKTRSDELKTQWQQTQQNIQKFNDQNSAMIGGTGAAPSADASAAPADSADASAPAAATPAAGSDAAPVTIVDAWADVDKLNAANDTSANMAKNYLEAATNALKQADTARAALVRSYTQRISQPANATAPEREAWQGIVDIYNPADLKLSLALADLRLARLWAGRATTAANRSMAASLVMAAAPQGAALPDTLKAAATSTDQSSDRDNADQAFKQADQLLTDLQQPGSSSPVTKAVQQSAMALQVVEIYSHAKFLQAMGDEKTAASLLSDSRTARDNAFAMNVPLPSLPPEIALTIAAPSAPAPAGPGSTPAPSPAVPAPAPAH